MPACRPSVKRWHQRLHQQVARLTAHVDSQGETLRPEAIFRDDGYSGGSNSRRASKASDHRVCRTSLS